MIIVVTGVVLRYRNDLVNRSFDLVPFCTFRRIYSVPKCEYNEDTIKHLVSSLESNEPVKITDVQVFRNRISFNWFYIDKSPQNYENIRPYIERFFNE